MHKQIEASGYDACRRPTTCSDPPIRRNSRPASEPNGLEQPPVLQYRAESPPRYEADATSRTGELNQMIQLLMRAFSSLHSDEEGQTVVEYALIMALVSIAAIGLLSAIGDFPSGVFREINNDF